MRDPIEELKSFNDGPTGGLPVNPLSPADVRRAGDRLRRRRNAGAAVAAVAALAVIATPFALLAGGDGEKAGDPPPVAPSPSAGDWLTSIPDGFPIAAGLGTNPEDGSRPTLGEGEEGGPGAITLCGEEVWPVDHLDRAWADLLPPAAHTGRELVLFESDVAAAKAMGNIAARLDQCPSETVFSDRAGSDQLLLHTRYDDGGLGEETIRFATYWEQGIDTDAYQLIRVGNAVALTTISDEGNEETVGGDVARLDDMAPRFVAEMAVFAEDAAGGSELADLLLTQDETTMGDPSGEASWVETGTYPGEGTSDFLPCLSPLADVGATEVAMRQFALDGVDPTGDGPAPAWTPGSGLVAMVAEFPDSGAAVAAYDTLAGDLEGCRSATFVDDLDRTSLQGPTGLQVGDAGARVAILTFGPAGQQTEQWLEVGIATLENRIAIVSSVKRMHSAVDPRLSETGPIELMTVAAAAHLPGPADEGPRTVDENGDPLAGDEYPVCTISDLSFEATYDGSGAGHRYYLLELRNESTGVCFVPGEAQAALFQGSGQVGFTAHSAQAEDVTLVPGADGVAISTVDITNGQNYDVATCEPEPVDNVALSWPGSEGSFTFDHEGVGCAGQVEQLAIEPWSHPGD